MGGMTDIVVLLLVVGGFWYLSQNGTLDQLLTSAGLPALPPPFGSGQVPQKQAAAPPPPPTSLATPTPPAKAPSGGGGTPPTPSSGGGSSISSGTTCPGGETCKEDSQGRFDCDGPKGDSYEATWCGTFSGDDLTIKMYGPPHSNDGDCCWCVVHVKESGEMVPGGEGPHPSSNCEHGGGKGAGKATCYKAIMKPGPIQEGYALIGGKWQLMFSHKGPCGCSKTATKKTGDQVTFRCDGNFKTTCATVKPLGGGGGPAPAATEAPADGGGDDAPLDAPDEPEESNYAVRRRRARSQAIGRNILSRL